MVRWSNLRLITTNHENVNLPIARIILGGGHKLLSPERRFDAAIMNNIELFGEERL